MSFGVDCSEIFFLLLTECVCWLDQHQVLIETDKATGQPVCRRLVLEFSDEEKTNAVVEVNKRLVQQLKPHQAEGRPHTQTHTYIHKSFIKMMTKRIKLTIRYTIKSI